MKWVNDWDCERKDQRLNEWKFPDQITLSKVIWFDDLNQKKWFLTRSGRKQRRRISYFIFSARVAAWRTSMSNQKFWEIKNMSFFELLANFSYNIKFLWSNWDSDMSMPYCSTPIPPLRTWLSECSKGAFWGLKVSNSAWLHFTRPLAQPPFSLLTLGRTK